MDEIDKKILQTLQKNARISLKNVAQKTYLSSPAVSTRIDKLEREKVITGYHAAVNPVKLGYPIMALISLDVAPGDKIKFYDSMEAIPNVLECNCVTGEYSMLMKVAFQSTLDLDIFVDQIQCYGKARTQIIFSTPVGPRGIDIGKEMQRLKNASGE
jgi:Lrp/AsnC family leucine-responsive transcriptional regulator